MKKITLLALWLLPTILHAHPVCTYCHINDTPTGVNATLSNSLPELCVTCHPDRVGKNEHIIGIPPPPTGMSQPLPLTNALISCTTCHDPHSQNPRLLRVEANELCRVCHQGK